MFIIIIINILVLKFCHLWVFCSLFTVPLSIDGGVEAASLSLDHIHLFSFEFQPPSLPFEFLPPPFLSDAAAPLTRRSPAPTLVSVVHRHLLSPTGRPSASREVVRYCGVLSSRRASRNLPPATGSSPPSLVAAGCRNPPCLIGTLYWDLGQTSVS
ncbi:unnamed protein product [Citrullus colocynthis]|uniref:Secreted protein n=1 Tax=Citrullus colocynthis TaxID=252529 RepID=A0ABP0XPP9_9ROSI